MAGATPEQLLAEYREILAALDALHHGDLDDVGRARLASLRARRDHLIGELQDAGLAVPVIEPRTGLWAPLPLHEPMDAPTTATTPPSESAEPSRLSDESLVLRTVQAIYEHGLPARTAYRQLEDFDFARLSKSAARLVAAVLDDSCHPEVASVARRRAGLSEPVLPAVVDSSSRLVPPAFCPSERDGLTRAQRSLVEALALEFPASQRVDVLIDDCVAAERPRWMLEEAVHELLLPRPHPVVERDAAHLHDHRLRLTPVAMEMIDVLDGVAHVHGGFFPNLLVNGAASPLVTPTHNLNEVLDAARLLVEFPRLDEESLSSRLPGPDFPDGYRCETPGPLYRSGEESLEFSSAVSFGKVAAVLSCLPPAVSSAEIVAALEAGRASGAIDGLVSCQRIGETVQYEVESPAFLRAALRFLDRLGLYRSSFRMGFFFEEGGTDQLVSRKSLLARFIERTEAAIDRRLLLQERALHARLQRLGELERALANRHRLERILDASLDGSEALWGLTHIGTREFAQHRAFTGLDTTGLEPLSEELARQFIKRQLRPRGDEVARIADELAQLREARSPGALRARCLDEFDRIARTHGRARRTVLSGRFGGPLFLR